MQLHLLCLVFLLPVSFSHESPAGFTNCSEPLELRCGSPSLNISYPFIANGRPKYCGVPGYRITCDGNETTLQLDGVTYLVKTINYTRRVVTLAETTSMEGDSCPVGVGDSNSSTLHDLFDLKDNNEVLSLLSCRDRRYEELHRINCISNGSEWSWFYYYRSPGEGWSLPSGCEPAVKNVWLHRTAVEELKRGSTSFWDALSRGFDAEWMEGKKWCGLCQGSGGVCGYNSSQRSRETCFCRDGTGAMVCGSESTAPIPSQDQAAPKGSTSHEFYILLILFPIRRWNWEFRSP